LPLPEEPLAVDPPTVDAPDEDAPDALVDELDDEHAAVTPSSNAAAAPAAGTDKDRFIPAPLNLGFRRRSRIAPAPARRARRWPVRLPPTGMFSCWQPPGNTWVDGAAAMSPMSRNSSTVPFPEQTDGFGQQTSFFAYFLTSVT
jgi:hypothetical protein